MGKSGFVREKHMIGFIIYSMVFFVLVAIIWFVFAVVYELLGIPLLLLEQNSPYFIVTIFGAIFWVIGLIVAYLTVQKRYMKG